MEYKVDTYTIEATDGLHWVAEFPEVKGVAGTGREEAEAVVDLYRNALAHINAMEQLKAAGELDKYSRVLVEEVIEIVDPKLEILSNDEDEVQFTLNDKKYRMYNMSDTTTPFIALEGVDHKFSQSRITHFDFSDVTYESLFRALLINKLVRVVS